MSAFYIFDTRFKSVICPLTNLCCLFQDTCIKYSWWQDAIACKINSRMIDCDSPFPHIQERSEAILQQEINLCTHVSCSHIVLDLPMKGNSIDNFAGILNRYLQNLTLQQKFVIRLIVPGDEAAAEKMYERYLELKHLVEHSIYFSVMLVLGADLPSASFLYRFFGEKIYAVQLPVSAFITNQKGFPVLSKAHQSACKVFMRVQARFVL